MTEEKMMKELTPVEAPAPRVEIEEQPGDTPGSIDIVSTEANTTGRAYANVLLAVATATQIFGSSHAGMTDFLVESKDLTELISEESPSRVDDNLPSHPLLTFDSSPESVAQAANRARLELLARLYVSKKLSAEEDARLAIVTEKVRRLIPRVTVEDFEILGAIARESETIRAKNDDRRRRLEI